MFIVLPSNQAQNGAHMARTQDEVLRAKLREVFAAGELRFAQTCRSERSCVALHSAIYTDVLDVSGSKQGTRQHSNSDTPVHITVVWCRYPQGTAQGMRGLSAIS